MALRSLSENHSFAGNFLLPSDLPNVLGAATQTQALQAGDFAYISPGRVFFCVDPTLGAAVWIEYNSERIAGVPLHIYVSAINGLDTNDGLSPATALATLVKAETMVPNVVGSDVVIHVGRFDLTGVGSYLMPKFKRRNLRANVFVFCDGAGQAGVAGDAFNELLASTVVQLASTSNQINGTFVVDAYRGKTIEILSGAAATFRCTVRNNTAGSIIPANTIGAAVVPGDLYRILEPTVNIGVIDTSVTGEIVFAEGMGGPDVTPRSDVLTSNFYVVNARFVLLGVASGNVSFCFRDSAVVFFGCEQSGTTPINIRLDSSSLTCGHNGADSSRGVGSYGLAILGVTNNLQWRAWGMSVLGNGFSTFSSGQLDGYMVFTRPLLLTENVTANVRGGSFLSPTGNAVSPVYAFKSLLFLIGPGSGSSSAVAPQILVETPSASAGIDVDFLARVSVANCSITAPLGFACIRCLRRAVCEITASGAPFTGLTGSAGGYALLVQLGGQIWGAQPDASVNGLWSDFGMTGGLGYFSVDGFTSADGGLTPGAILPTSGNQLLASDSSCIVRVT